MKTLFKLILLSLCVFSFNHKASAQVKRHVWGTVYDTLTKEPLPFVNIKFVGTSVGATTDINGEFEIQTEWGSDSLEFSFLGYQKKVIYIAPNQKIKATIYLEASVSELATFEVKAEKKRYKNKDNPAVQMIQEVIARKNENRLYNYPNVQVDKYTKEEYDINNIEINEKAAKRSTTMQVVKTYIDTNETSGKPYLPLLLKESQSTVYTQTNPYKQREYVKAQRISGFEESVFGNGASQLLSAFNEQINVYESKIDVLDKTFPSPISGLALHVYRYYLTDSIEVNNIKTYEIKFTPRDPDYAAFQGTLWVLDSTQNYALKKAELEIGAKANVNFLNSLKIIQTFEPYDTLGWLLSTDTAWADIGLSELNSGFYIQVSSFYDNYQVNQPIPDSINTGINTIIIAKDADIKNSAYWDTTRTIPLSEKEQKIYEMTTTVTNLPEFRNLLQFMEFAFTGYVKMGKQKKWEIGPVATAISFNDIEGARIKVGGRTTLNFHEKWRLKGFLAYGTKDEITKYGATVEYFWSKVPRNYFHIDYEDNTYQPGYTITTASQDNLFSSFRRTASTTLLYHKRWQTWFEKEWTTGFSTRLFYKHEQNFANPFNPFISLDPEQGEIDMLPNAEIGVRFRLAFNEKFIQGNFDRQQILTEAPIFFLEYAYSDENTGSIYKYHKLRFRFEKRLPMGIFGFSDLRTDASAIFGTAPYPFLHIHPGNETMFASDYSYNLMNFMEFGGDRAIDLFLTHHFNGLLLGKIPLIQNLKWRTVASYKMAWGYLSDQNNDQDNPALLEFPQRFHTLNDSPYIEASLGIENIFKIMRFDVVKRFTHLENQQIPSNSGVEGLAYRLSFALYF